MADPAQPSLREFSARAVASGLLVGALLAVANLYVGLAVGFWDSGHVTAAVLAFALLSLFGRGHSRGETAFAITLATASGAMPAVTGLIGAIPALAQLGAPRPAAWLLALWGVSLSALGVLIALMLRKRLVEDEQLPFPSGIAAAEVANALHGGAAGSGKARALGLAAAIAAVFTWLRDGAWALIPGGWMLPGKLTLGVAASPLLLGVGGLIGLRVAVALLLGSVLAWVGIVSALVRAGTSAEAAAQFVAWPAVGLLVGAAAVSLARLARTFVAGARDLAAAGAATLRGPPRAASWIASVGSGLAIATAAAVFGLSPPVALLALFAALPLAALCGRAAGQADVSPAGQVSQLTQAAAGPLVRTASADAGAGAVVFGTSAQTGVTLWSLRAAGLLGATMRAQAVAALIGTAAGAAITAGAYAVLFRGGALPKLPIPNAQQWRTLAELAASGTAALPQGALLAAALGVAAGLALQLLAGTGAAKWLPDATALGVGMLLPVNLAATAVIGAAAAALLSRASADRAALVGSAAGGLVAGESIAGLALAVAAALK